MTDNSHDHPSRFGVIALLLFGALCVAACLQEILGSYAISQSLMSKQLWAELTTALGGQRASAALEQDLIELPLGTLFAGQLTLAAFCWLGGAGLLSIVTKARFGDILWIWGRNGFRWWLLPGLWLLLWTVTSIADWQTIVGLLNSTSQLWLSLTMAGFAASFCTLATFHDQSTPLTEEEPTRRIPKLVWIAATLYVVVFTTMNWQLYRGLLLPHGDSAMYEEHLWNLAHGKGFRSYLDPGLFLGEHMQVIHVALLPLHLVWPSQMLLELCESLALASGAIPVFWIARRHTHSEKGATLLACAYVLYFPLQFLDIAIDLKTFRPTAFGVPLFMFAIDQLERKRWWTMTLLLILTLTAKEDYSLVIAPLGVWLLIHSWRSRGHSDNENQPAYAGRSPGVAGAAMALLGVGYLLLVLLVLIPAFRSGNDPHYTGYFGWLHEAAAATDHGGSTAKDETAGPLAITQVVLTRPTIWLRRIFSIQSLFYVLTLLLPAGFVALCSPGRLAVAGPLFAVLCLMEVSGGAPTDASFPLVPFHHFHAPLVPIIFWASAAGLPVAAGCLSRMKSRILHASRSTTIETTLPESTAWTRHFVWTSALAGGLFLSLGPLSVPFWDTGSQWYWRSLYVPGQRAEEFAAVMSLVPQDARVASTDLIHPRFTHHERAYDYSEFHRAVNNNKPGAPPDTEYIVIDKQSRYSTISQPDDVREYREQPDRWDILLNNEYYLVLKRKSANE